MEVGRYEAFATVVLDHSFMARKPSRSAPICRRGMRILLQYMEECVSTWPQGQRHNDMMRQCFHEGMKTVDIDGLELVFELDYSDSVYRLGISHNKLLAQDWEGDCAARAKLLPTSCYTAVVKAKSILDLYKGTRISAFPEDWTESVTRYLRPDDLTRTISAEGTACLQCFLLGFYYRLLPPSIDQSLLQVAEAWGAWSYNDFTFFSNLAWFLGDLCDGQRPNVVSRPCLLEFAAYLFAGADPEYAKKEDWYDAMGHISKLAIMTSSCLGCFARLDKFGMLVLVDVDVTSFPCSAAEFIRSGHQREMQGPLISAMPGDREKLCISDLAQDLALARDVEDFSVHMECDVVTDWQKLMLVYRYRGRLVYKVPPQSPENYVQSAMQDDYLSRHSGEADMGPVRYLAHMDISACTSGTVYYANETTALVIDTLYRPVARTCIMAMYRDTQGAATQPGPVIIPINLIRPIIVHKDEDISTLLQRGSCTIILSEDSHIYQFSQSRSGSMDESSSQRSDGSDGKAYSDESNVAHTDTDRDNIYEMD